MPTAPAPLFHGTVRTRSARLHTPNAAHWRTNFGLNFSTRVNKQTGTFVLFCLQLDCQILPLKCAVWSWNETAHPEDFIAVKRGAAQDKTALLEYFGTVERLFPAHIYWNIML